MEKKVYIGSDHAGYELKEILKEYLINTLKLSVIDKGAFSLNKDDDYPDYIRPVAESVASDEASLGIVLGGSGEGEQIVANKIDGVRAIEYYGGTLEIIKLGREHNDANILSIGARFVNKHEAKKAVEIFIKTSFSKEERHKRRLDKIKRIEEKN